MQKDRGQTRDWSNIAARLAAQLEEFDCASLDEPSGDDIGQLKQETLAEFLRREFGREDAN